MALPSGPVDEPELCFGSPTWWNRGMVFREQGINRMEKDWIFVVGSWKTYVSRTTDERSELIICQSLSWCRQKHASVCDLFTALFDGVHNYH